MSVALTLACLGFLRANWDGVEENFRRAREARTDVWRKLQRRHWEGRERFMATAAKSWLCCVEVLDRIKMFEVDPRAPYAD